MAHGMWAQARDLQNVIPLTRLKTGDDGVILRLNGNEEFRSKMLALGIIPGKRIKVAKGDVNQPYILRVDESRIMIDWTTLNEILVQPETGFKRRGGWRW